MFFWLGFMIRKLPEVFGKIKWYMWLAGFAILFVMWEMVDSGTIHSLLEIAIHVTGSIAAFETLGILLAQLFLILFRDVQMRQ